MVIYLLFLNLVAETATLHHSFRKHRHHTLDLNSHDTCLRKVGSFKENETEENKVVDNMSDLVKYRDLVKYSGVLKDNDATNRIPNKRSVNQSKSAEDGRWSKKVVSYSVMNIPKCSEITHERVNELVREAASSWNRVEANIVLKDIDELMAESNDATYSDDDIDIKIYFYPCQHKYLTNMERDKDFNCSSQFAHAFYPEIGDIHLNAMMTWTDKYYGNIIEGELLKPNLYSIVLHEFGHSLGLSHNSVPGSVMNYDFAGNRAYTRLQIAQTSQSVLIDLYPVIPKCTDSYGYCQESYCNDITIRDSCQRTCQICEQCGPDVQDEYIKCTQEVCSSGNLKLRLYCKKTCGICDKPRGCTTPMVRHGKPKPHLPLYKIGEKVQVSCNRGYIPRDRTIHLTCAADDSGLQAYWHNLGMDLCKIKPCEDRHQNCMILLLRKRKCSERRMKRVCKKSCNLCSSLSNSRAWTS